MARFDAWPNPEGAGWLLDVQADLLHDLNTRVVVPLMPPETAPKPAARLSPVLTVAGAPMVMVTQVLSAVPAALLRGDPVPLSDPSAAIGTALDLLVTGV
ncbi:MAG: CcdB family protein [Burkholderiaceae bacterium]|nr:CcdB family protein [Burkholderiaceae bacterium]